MTVPRRSLMNVRRHGGKRTIKSKATKGTPNMRHKMDTLETWPVCTNKHYRAGDGGRR